MLSINYKDPRTLHRQIKDGIKELVQNGIWPGGMRLPSVRELSVELTVNPNTIQRAYRELEQEGYIASVPGKGSFVAAQLPPPDAEQLDALYGALSKTLRELWFLGEAQSRVMTVVEDIWLQKEGTI